MENRNCRIFFLPLQPQVFVSGVEGKAVLPRVPPQLLPGTAGVSCGMRIESYNIVQLLQSKPEKLLISEYSVS
jgi:hypothetical protein